MICKKCGFNTYGNFCANCGEKLRTESEIAFEEKKRARKKYIDGNFSEDSDLKGRRIREKVWDIAEILFEEREGRNLTKASCKLGDADRILALAEKIFPFIEGKRDPSLRSG